jgi:hypothetical protein
MYPSGYSADNTADSGYVDPTAARGPSRPSDLGTQPKGSTLISTTIQARRHLWEYHHPASGLIDPDRAELVNADTGQPLYVSPHHRRRVLAAARENYGGEMDVIDASAIAECALYGRVVYA